LDDEVHGTADEDRLIPYAELLLGGGAQVGEDDGDEVFELKLPSEHARRLEQAAGEKRLERLHEASARAGAGIAVRFDRARSRAGLRLSSDARLLGVEVQHRSKGRGGPAVEAKHRQSALTVRAGACDRAVRRA